MNEQIKAIRAEIKRLEEIHERNLGKPMERGRKGHAHGYVDCCDEILSFIDTLLEETDNEAPNRPKLSDNLGEAARLYAIPHCMKDIDVHHIEEYPYDTGLEAAFIAGANWQKEQSDKELSEKIAAAYQLGLANKEKQMMKGAVEGEVCGRVYDHINIRFADGVCKFLEPKNISHIPADVSKYKVGEKVRIIIVKEDER